MLFDNKNVRNEKLKSFIIWAYDAANTMYRKTEFKSLYNREKELKSLYNRKTKFKSFYSRKTEFKLLNVAKRIKNL